MYNEFGGIGWKYFTDELVRGNEILDDYIEISHKTKELKRIIHENETCPNKRMGRVHKLINDPDFKNKVSNYFDLVKNGLLNEYKCKIHNHKGHGKNAHNNHDLLKHHSNKPTRKNMTVVTKTSGDGNGAIRGNLSSAISSKSRKSGIYGP